MSSSVLNQLNQQTPSAFLQSLTTPFDIQRYLSFLVSHPAPIDLLITAPPIAACGDAEGSVPLLWCVENLKKLVIDMNTLIVNLTTPSNAAASECACESMTLVSNRRLTADAPKPPQGEEIRQDAILCLLHEHPSRCTAVEYSFHFLDYAMDVLSRETVNVRTLSTILRRCFTVLNHIWLVHPSEFRSIESRLRLFQRCVALALRYDLIKPSVIFLLFHPVYQRDVLASELPAVLAEALAQVFDLLSNNGEVPDYNMMNDVDYETQLLEFVQSISGSSSPRSREYIRVQNSEESSEQGGEQSSEESTEDKGLGVTNDGSEITESVSKELEPLGGSLGEKAAEVRVTKGLRKRSKNCKERNAPGIAFS